MPDKGSERLLDAIILELLQAAGAEMTYRELERRVAERLEQGVDTSALRQAIWRLIADRSAILTPQRTLRAS
jgi:hypothetical protein